MAAQTLDDLLLEQAELRLELRRLMMRPTSVATPDGAAVTQRSRDQVDKELARVCNLIRQKQGRNVMVFC